jgi:Skp family chaperone for outer membrane proteins
MTAIRYVAFDRIARLAWLLQYRLSSQPLAINLRTYCRTLKAARIASYRKDSIIMKTTANSLRVLAVLACTAISRAEAAAPNQPAHTPGRTATIDVGHIFENSVYVKGELEKIRRDAEATTERFKTLESQLRTMNEQLKQFQEGSVEYTRQEAAVVQKQADARVEAQLKQKQLEDRRSTAYFTAYQQIEQLVALYSLNNNITLVLRSNRKEPAAPQTAAERMRHIQRPVVFEQNIDITLPILEELNRRATLSLNTSK